MRRQHRLASGIIVIGLLLASCDQSNPELEATKQELRRARETITVLEQELKEIQIGDATPRGLTLTTQNGKTIQGAKLLHYHPYAHWPHLGKDFHEKPLELDDNGIAIKIDAKNFSQLKVHEITYREDNPERPHRAHISLKASGRTYIGEVSATGSNFYLILPDAFPVADLNKYFHASADHPYQRPELKEINGLLFLRVPLGEIRSIDFID